MPPDLDAALLRAFVASARAGSISGAAAALGRTQPALSLQVRRLEHMVGDRLLRRAPSGVSLTEAGEALLPLAERILALSAEVLNGGQKSRGLAGHCGIGVLEDLVSSSLPAALAEFARQHPGISLEAVSSGGAAMRAAYDAGRIQLALGNVDHFAQAPRWTSRLPVCWAASPELDLTTDPLPLILFSLPCGWRAPVLAALDNAGRRWRVAFESTSLTGIQAALRAGVGVAAVIPATVGPGLAIVGPKEGLPPLPDVEIGLLRRPGTEGDALVDAVEELLRRLV
jgi:DNA-binding transcriptional LysR family regulator